MHDHAQKPPIPVVVIQKFSVPREKVYDAFLDEIMIAQWMFGPKLRDEKIIHVQIDPKIGGKFSFKVQRGEDELDHIGEYLELNRAQRLAFTWSIDPHPPSYVYINIDPIETGCEVTLTHEIDSEWSAYLPRIQDGWAKMLRVLNTLLK